MPLVRKRRTRDVEEAPESSEEEPQARTAHRRRTATDDNPPSPNTAAAADDDNDNDNDAYGSDSGGNAGGVVPLARKLCRYALACEYARQPIRKADISAKVLPSNSGRMLKSVFAEAQNMLREVFGMEMVELPVREKVTLQQKRAAQTQGKTATTSNAWILQSTLPPKYRAPSILPPPAIPTTEQESSYVALYTFIVTTIYLHGGRLPDTKLDLYLRRLNADENTPLGTKDELLKRLVREQYIMRNVDRSNPHEEVIEYLVGPRGKVEVGEEGAGGLVRTVYAGSVDDLEARIDRSLGISGKEAARAAKEKEASANGTGAANGERRQSKRGQRQREESSSDENGSEDEDEDE